MVDPSDNLNLNPPDADLPASFKADLRDHYRSAPPQALSRVDAAIRAAARSHFPPREEAAVIATLGPRRWAWKLGALTAAAAAIAIVLFINPFADKGPRNLQGPIGLMKDGKEFQPGDVNLDGRIDILDAYLLQRELEGGPATAISLWEDLTGDHKLDQQDVNALAAAAVKLGGPRL